MKAQPLYTGKFITSNMIIVYSTRTCTACDRLKTILNEKNIEYENKIVNEDIKADDFIDKFGVTTVPVIVIDDKTYFGVTEELLTDIEK